MVLQAGIPNDHDQKLVTELFYQYKEKYPQQFTDIDQYKDIAQKEIRTVLQNIEKTECATIIKVTTNEIEKILNDNTEYVLMAKNEYQIHVGYKKNNRYYRKDRQIETEGKAMFNQLQNNMYTYQDADVSIELVFTIQNDNIQPYFITDPPSTSSAA